MQAKRVLCHKEDGSAACSGLPSLPTRCSDRIPPVLPVMGRGGDECLGSSKLAVIIRCLHAFFSSKSPRTLAGMGRNQVDLSTGPMSCLVAQVVMPARRFESS